MDLITIINILEGNETDDVNVEVGDRSVHAPPSEPIQYQNLQNDDSSDSYTLLNLDQQNIDSVQNNSVDITQKPECSPSIPQSKDGKDYQEPGCSTWGNSNIEERRQGYRQENQEPGCSSWSNTENKLFFVESKKSGKILLRNGYRYRINRKNKCGSSIWYCTRKNCKASLTLDENETNILRTGGKDHICLPDYKKEEFEIKFNQCKKNVRTDLKPIPTMYAMSMASLKDNDYVDHVRSFQSVKNALYRSRNKFLNVRKTTFKNLEDVKISPVIGKDFLVVDSGGQSKILIFMLNDCKKALQSMNLFFVDGTFFSVPPPFYQLYTIHADIGSTADKTVIVPIIFALLPDKSQSTYTNMFKMVKDYIPEFHPIKFKIDFEIAAINAIKEVFPLADISGCFFHFHKALWKKAQQTGIVNVPGGKKYISMCAATAHLPKTFIPEAWVSLLESAPEGNEAKLFNEYVTSQWMNKNIDLICCYKERHRTTNPVEGWHNRLNKKLSKRPPLYTLISTLRDEAKEARFIIEQANVYNDNNQKQRNKKKLATDMRINKIVEDFTSNKIDLMICLKRLSSVRFDN